jgi:hypothetical protein
MQIPSTYFSNKISQDNLKWKTKIEFFTSDKTSAVAVTLSDEDLIENTLQIDSQTTGNDNFILGGVSSSQCKFNINVQGINKLNAVHLLKKKSVFRVKVWLQTDDPSQSQVDPSLNTNNTENTSGRLILGIFYIDKIQDNNFDTQIEAYDGMQAFETAVSNIDLQHLYATGATITQYMTRYADTCSVDTYSISADITVLPDNNSNPLYYSNDLTPQTYREVLGYLSQIGCGFFYLNADGNLAFKKYAQSSVASLPHTKIYDYTQGNETFQTRKVTMNVAAFNVTANSSAQLQGNRAEMFYNENPFVRYMFPDNPNQVPASVQQIINSMLSAVDTLLFTSGSYEIINRPDFEIGDKITVTVKQIDRVTDQIVDKTYSDILICKYSWKYQTYASVTSLGYAKASANKQTQNTSKIKQQSGSAPVNATIRTLGTQALSIGQGASAKMFTVFYVLQRDIESMFTISATLNVLSAGTYRLRIQLDGVDYITQPKQYVADTGYYTFSYTFGTGSFDYDGQHSLVITLISLDTFAASVAINDYQLLLTASAVHETTPQWTGLYEVEDYVDSFDILDALNFGTLADDVSAVIETSPTPPTPTVLSKTFTATQFTVDQSVSGNTASLRTNTNADDGYDWDNLGNVYVEDTVPAWATKMTIKVSCATSGERRLRIWVDSTMISDVMYDTGSYDVPSEYTVATDLAVTGGSTVKYTLDGPREETGRKRAPLTNHLEVIYSS